MHNVSILSTYNIGCLPFDELDRLESFVHVAYGQVVAKVKHGILGVFVTVFQPHKIPHCPPGHHPGGHGLWAGTISLSVVITRVLGLSSITWECNLYDHEALPYCITQP